MIPVFVENRGRETVFLSTCGGELQFEVERLENGAWVGIRGASCLAMYGMVPVRLDPGELYQGTDRVPALPGEYRLRLAVRVGPDQERWETITSPRFVID